MQGKLLALREVHILRKPLIVAAQLRGRSKASVRNHGKDRSLKGYRAVLVLYRPLKYPPQTKLLPQLAHRMEGSVLPAVLELPAVKTGKLLKGQTLPDAGGKLTELGAALAVHPSQGAYDPGLGHLLLLAPVVFHYLEVGDLRSVAVLAGHCSEKHSD